MISIPFLVVFLFTLFLSFSTYFFYPIIIWILGQLIPFRVNREKITPKVSIIISAYNEEKNIEKKIQNTLALEYPKDRMEILVGSDGSTDETTNLVRKYTDQRVKFVDFKINRGKTAVQNDLVKRSNGKILIFTDAASSLHADALNKIILGFADERVGCVAGRMRFVNTNSNLTTQSQGVYWRYELKLREMESRLGSLIGVDGPLYAVRRSFYIPLREDIISDLITPLLVLAQGKKVVLESDALVDEDPTRETSQEFNTRRRITLRGLTGLSAHFELLNLLRHPLLPFQIFFHKVLRWFVGPLVALNFLACLALSTHSFFKVVIIIYLFFFLAAGIGWGAEYLGMKVRILTVPYYFSLVNLAATMGIVDFFRKRKATTWKTVRD